MTTVDNISTPVGFIPFMKLLQDENAKELSYDNFILGSKFSIMKFFLLLFNEL